MKTAKLALILSLAFGALTANAQNVGIRTDTPKSILDVSSTSSGILMPRMDSITRVGLTVGADQDGMQVFDTDSKTAWYYNHNQGKWKELNGTSNKSVDGNTTTDAVYTTGNIGIGTNSPTEKLEVAGNIQSNDTLKSNAFLVDDPALVTSTNLHSEIIATVGTNVGFGTPTPSAKLSVNGDANKTGGGSWAVFSDERSKEAITDYTKGSKELLEIEPKSFQYKEAFGWGTDTHIGLIAQEVETVVPSMVTTKEVQHIKDFREVDPNELNYMLINAVKELDAKTKALNEAIRQAEQDADAGLEQLRAQAEELKQLKKVLEKHGVHTQGSVVRSN